MTKNPSNTPLSGGAKAALLSRGAETLARALGRIAAGARNGRK